ncbi:hypothetical protein O181_112303 [Austropuccinia psidii MF-1]|uniref:Integrase catalytic domain-containing protein n=1 Tax=Austropuccinia psidii MF-1 TaxID=1389203 RepID=A0A9Q3K089_9BASI|nr:hypothetical protein [Austropuccinia psidii MF-1]
MSILTDIDLLHARAGHPGLESLQRMFQVPNKIINCDACALSKSHRLPYSGVLPHITDQFSHFKCIFLLKKKSEALVNFQNYCQQVFSLFGSYPINVVMDNGGEFVSNSFRNYFKKLGTITHYTAPYTPQQNPVSERGNRSTSEKARALLIHASLLNVLWGEAVVSAVLYENITPTRHHKKSAYELWYGRCFNYSRLRVFGCKAFVDIPKAKRLGKFSDTARIGILVGYKVGQNNWRILFPEMKVIYSHHVIFHETVFPGRSFFNSNKSASTFDLFPLPMCENLQDENQVSTMNSLEQSQVLPSKSSHEILAPVGRKAPKDISSEIYIDNVITKKRSRQGNALHVVDEFNQIPYDTTEIVSSVPIVCSLNIPPKTYHQAVAAVDADAWIHAIQATKMALERKNVWEVFEIPSQAHLIHSV